MDPFSQGFLGAAAAQSVSRKSDRRWTLLLGFLSGGAADLDVLMFLPGDPLSGLMLHRHFTHALVFIPIGAALCALGWWLITRRKMPWRLVFLYALVAYATHGVLDAMTSYGTVLLWPFSDVRIAWDWLPIVDPFITIPLLVGTLWTAKTGRAAPVRVALALAVTYMGFGAVQQNRAHDAQLALAEARGHELVRGRVMPTLGSTLTWRSVYEHDGRYWMDTVHVPVARPAQTAAGTTVVAFAPDDMAVPAGSVLARDIARYSWFADGYLTALPPAADGSVILADARYRMGTASFRPLWGLKTFPTLPNQPGEHVGLR